MCFTSFPPAAGNPHSLLQQLQVHLAQVQGAAILSFAIAVRPEAVLWHHTSLQPSLQVDLSAASVPDCRLAGAADSTYSAWMGRQEGSTTAKRDASALPS